MARQAQDAAVANIGAGIGAMGTGAMYAFMDDDDEGSKKNGGIVKTKGEFSHKDNPIHMVQKGEKVGEMTGGEYIFNPEQMSKIKALSKTSPEKLSKYIKSLVNKFEKK
jgi:hypothetical protein